MQTRKQSAIEIVVKTGCGFFVAWVITMNLLPLWENPSEPQSAFEITCMYTVQSMVLSYAVRRWFNGRAVNRVQRITDKTVLELMGVKG